MAWDTEGTRRRLREAATVEFAERGPDATTMAGIAERAGINKERLYSYFGDKRALWETVLAEELAKLSAAVELTTPTMHDIGEFAGATYDYHAAHPSLARLLQWEGLSGGPPAGARRRVEHYREKVERVAAAQRGGIIADDVDPADLVFALIALAAWWQTVPQLATMITGADGSDAAERAKRRAFVVEAARRIAAPR